MGKLIVVILVIGIMQPLAFGRTCRKIPPIESLSGDEVVILGTVVGIIEVKPKIRNNPFPRKSYQADLLVEQVLKGPKTLRGKMKMTYSKSSTQGSMVTFTKGERWVIGSSAALKGGIISLGTINCYNSAVRIETGERVSSDKTLHCGAFAHCSFLRGIHC